MLNVDLFFDLFLKLNMYLRMNTPSDAQKRKDLAKPLGKQQFGLLKGLHSPKVTSRFFRKKWKLDLSPLEIKSSRIILAPQLMMLSLTQI